MVVLVIDDQAYKALQPAGAEPAVTVAKGSGQARLSKTITLPDTGTTTVHVILLLMPTGATSTTLAAGADYPVQ
jgi:hypothetical protein